MDLSWASHSTLIYTSELILFSTKWLLTLVCIVEGELETSQLKGNMAECICKLILLVVQIIRIQWMYFYVVTA